MPSKIETLIQRIHEQTKAGKLKWQLTESEEVFQAAIPNYALRISTRPNRNNRQHTDYVITIYNDEGSPIEDVIDIDLDWSSAGYDPEETMKDIYDMARGQAMGVEEALNELLNYFSGNEEGQE
jgi:hypothetical protein